MPISGAESRPRQIAPTRWRAAILLRSASPSGSRPVLRGGRVILRASLVDLPEALHDPAAQDIEHHGDQKSTRPMAKMLV